MGEEFKNTLQVLKKKTMLLGKRSGYILSSSRVGHKIVVLSYRKADFVDCQEEFQTVRTFGVKLITI